MKHMPSSPGQGDASAHTNSDKRIIPELCYRYAIKREGIKLNLVHYSLKYMERKAPHGLTMIGIVQYLLSVNQ